MTIKNLSRNFANKSLIYYLLANRLIHLRPQPYFLAIGNTKSISQKPLVAT